MTKFSSILALIAVVALFSFSAAAQETPGITISSLSKVLPGMPDAGTDGF